MGLLIVLAGGSLLAVTTVVWLAVLAITQPEMMLPTQQQSTPSRERYR